ENTKNKKPIQVEGNNSGSLEHINKSNPSWNEQKEELKENRTYITKEKILSVERNNNTETLLEQHNNTSTYNKEVIEVNTHNEEVFKTSTYNEDNIQTTIYNKEVSETSTDNKNNMKTTTQNEPRNEQEDFTLERNTTFSSTNIRPEQEPHAGSSANKEENPYLQDDASIIDGVGLQKNDITQDEQKRPLSSSMEIDNDKRNFTPSRKQKYRRNITYNRS
ncbi:59_t:CDS:2, partial [Cetraspora pellucida]